MLPLLPVDNPSHGECLEDRIQFMTAVTGAYVHELAQLCIPLSDRSSRYRLRSTTSRQLVICLLPNSQLMDSTLLQFLVLEFGTV